MPDDSSSTVVSAKTDIGQYINESASDVISRRVWREFVIFGGFTVPANQRFIPYSSIVVDTGFPAAGNGYNPLFAEVISIANGTQLIVPADPASQASIDPTVINGTTAPTSFLNLGNTGIYLLGTFSTATALRFVGKATDQDFAGNETWLMNNDAALIAGATFRMKQDFDKDDISAQVFLQDFEAEIAKMIDTAEVQSGNIKRVVPQMPFTAIINNVDTTVTGASWTFT